MKWTQITVNKGYELILPVIAYCICHNIKKIYFKTFISKEVVNIYSLVTKETVHIKQRITTDRK